MKKFWVSLLVVDGDFFLNITITAKTLVVVDGTELIADGVKVEFGNHITDLEILDEMEIA